MLKGDFIQSVEDYIYPVVVSFQLLFYMIELPKHVQISSPQFSLYLVKSILHGR